MSRGSDSCGSITQILKSGSPVVNLLIRLELRLLKLGSSGFQHRHRFYSSFVAAEEIADGGRAIGIDAVDTNRIDAPKPAVGYGKDCYANGSATIEMKFDAFSDVGTQSTSFDHRVCLVRRVLRTECMHHPCIGIAAAVRYEPILRVTQSPTNEVQYRGD